MKAAPIGLIGMCLALCLALCLAQGCSHSTPPEADDAGVRQWLSDFTKAFSARDTKAITALYAPDVIAYDIAPPLRYSGRDAYGKDFDAFFAQFKGPMTLEIRDLHIHTSGDLAMLDGLEHMTGTTTGGQPLDVWMRFTTGLRKENGQWLDFHDHVSVPTDFSTGKAVLDLKP